MSGAARRVAIVGASSLIGEALIEQLRAHKFPAAELHALDEGRDLGRKLADEDRELPVGDVDAFDFSRVDLVFFCGRAAVSQRHAEKAAEHAIVIDSSSAFRARSEVPLVAADVNPQALENVGRAGLIALPGSASVALATVLAPLHGLAGLRRVDVATYQAVSGGGRAAMEGLASETVDLLSGRKLRARSFDRQIAFNVIPQVDVIDADGVSREERRLLEETRRVLGVPTLDLNATAVRVPVFFGHGLAVHAAFDRPIAAAEAGALLQRSSGIAVIDPQSREAFPTPAQTAIVPDRVYVGRIRADMTRDQSLNFWVVADNVRKCAAYNAFSVAQILVNRGQ